MTRPRRPKRLTPGAAPDDELRARADALRARFTAVMRLLEEKRAGQAASGRPGAGIL